MESVICFKQRWLRRKLVFSIILFFFILILLSLRLSITSSFWLMILSSRPNLFRTLICSYPLLLSNSFLTSSFSFYMRRCSFQNILNIFSIFDFCSLSKSSIFLNNYDCILLQRALLSMNIERPFCFWDDWNSGSCVKSTIFLKLTS